MLQLEEDYPHIAVPAPGNTSQRLVTIRDIEKIRKRIVKQRRLHAHDGPVCDALYEHFQKVGRGGGPDGVILKYERTEDSFFMIISSPLQRRLLKAFGSQFVFMDAVHGINKYGYPISRCCLWMTSTPASPLPSASLNLRTPRATRGSSRWCLRPPVSTPQASLS